MAVGEDLDLDMPRAWRTKRSTNRRPSPKACCASAVPAAQAPASSASVVDPAHAAPTAAGSSLEQDRVAHPVGDRAASPSVVTTSEPSLTAMPSSRAAARAVALSPLRRIAAADGPTNAIPASAHAAGSSGRSETKP